MRSFEEEKRGYEICKKSRDEEEAYRRLSEKVGGHTARRINEDITSDLIGSIVYKKIMKTQTFRRRRPKGEPMSFRGFVYTLMAILSMVALAYYGLSRKQVIAPPGSEYGTGEFNFEDGENFKNILYFGKSKLMMLMVSHIAKMVHLMKSLPEKDLLKTMETTQRNLMLWGPRDRKDSLMLLIST